MNEIRSRHKELYDIIQYTKEMFDKDVDELEDTYIKWNDPYLSLMLLGFNDLIVVEKETGNKLYFGYEIWNDNYDEITVKAYMPEGKKYTYRIEKKLEKIFGIRQDEDEE